MMSIQYVRPMCQSMENWRVALHRLGRGRSVSTNARYLLRLRLMLMLMPMPVLMLMLILMFTFTVPTNALTHSDYSCSSSCSCLVPPPHSMPFQSPRRIPGLHLTLSPSFPPASPSSCRHLHGASAPFLHSLSCPLIRTRILISPSQFSSSSCCLHDPIRPDVVER